MSDTVLKEMDYVYAIYKEKSFSKAAKKLFISQPALSATVKKLEQQINVQLFDRSSNPITLTVEGQYYIENIEKIMTIVNDMRAYFMSVSKTEKPSIKIGSSAFFCAHILPTRMYNFNHQNHNSDFILIEKNANELMSDLENGQVDVGVTVDTINSTTLTKRIWKEETIILAVPASYTVNESLKDFQLTHDDIIRNIHLDPAFPSVDLVRFKGEPFLFLQEGNDLNKRAYTMCKNRGFNPKIVMYLDQMLTSYYVAHSGNGIVFLRDEITNHVQNDNKLIFYKINDSLATRNIMIYYRTKNKKNILIEAFTNYLSTT